MAMEAGTVAEPVGETLDAETPTTTPTSRADTDSRDDTAGAGQTSGPEIPATTQDSPPTTTGPASAADTAPRDGTASAGQTPHPETPSTARPASPTPTDTASKDDAASTSADAAAKKQSTKDSSHGFAVCKYTCIRQRLKTIVRLYI